MPKFPVAEAPPASELPRPPEEQQQPDASCPDLANFKLGMDQIMADPKYAVLFKLLDVDTGKGASGSGSG